MSDNLCELSQEEEEYLDANYHSWHLLPGQGRVGLVIKDFPVPSGYNLQKSDMMLIIPQNYPAAPLDMFYFAPQLVKENGNVINALTIESCFEQEWQRWSRHYEWIPGEDNVISHIERTKAILLEEANQ